MRHKYRTLALRKKHAAMIANASRRRRGLPSINAEVAAESRQAHAPAPHPEGRSGTREPKGQVGSRR